MENNSTNKVTLILSGLWVSVELLPTEYSILLFIVLALFFGAGKIIFWQSLKILLPALCLLSISTIVSIIQMEFSRDSIKGIYYLIRPIIIFIFGFSVGRIYSVNELTIVKSVIIATIFLSLFYITKYYVLDGASIYDRMILRSTVGAGYITVAVGIGLAAIYLLRGEMLMLSCTALALGSTCIFLSDSRTSLIASIIFAFSSIITLMGTRRIIVLIFFILVFTTTPYLSLIIPDWRLGEIIYSIPQSASELISIDRIDEAEINDGWRGYETFRAFDYILKQGLPSILFGSGLHSKVPLLIDIELGGEIMSAIPIFHNGFAFIFVRAGFFGLLLYLLQLIVIASTIKINTHKNLYFPRDIFFKNNFIASGITSILIITPLVAGFYGVSGSFLTLIVAVCVGSLDKDKN